MIDDILSTVAVVHALPAHLPWVFSTFREQAAQLPLGSRHGAHELACALLRVVRGPGRCVVAIPDGYADEPLGWSVSLGGSVLFAYVRASFRCHGIGTQLVSKLVDSIPVHLAFWTDDADAIQRHGVAIDYDIHAFRALCTYVRREPRRQQQSHRKAA
jgi:ribosomal protein S18 acetylase RimI-like enzyme